MAVSTGTPRDLRRILREPKLLVAPGCFDALSARLIEALGFSAVYLGGWALGSSLACGEPRTNLTDMLQRSQEIRRAVSLPLVVDGDAGFGDAVHVEYTVAAAAAAGIDAIHIEDQVFPKRMHYHAGIEHIIPLPEMLAKIDAAVQTRGGGPFCIIGRTDAIKAQEGSFDEAVRRANAYLEHGVDAVMLFPQTREQAESLPRLVHGPLVYVWVAGSYPPLSTKELEDLGWRLVIYPITAVAASFQAVERVIRGLKQDGVPAITAEEMTATRARIQEVLKFEHAWELERRTTEAG